MTELRAQQARYWKEVAELRVNVYYLAELEADLRRKDFLLNAFLLLTSGSSIATWALWKDLPWLWAILIAAAQVFTILKPILPYRKLLEAIVGLKPSRELHAIDAEEEWHEVSSGTLSAAEINARRAELLRRRARDAQAHVKGATIPYKEELMLEAKETAARYFRPAIN